MYEKQDNHKSEIYNRFTKTKKNISIKGNKTRKKKENVTKNQLENKV